MYKYRIISLLFFISIVFSQFTPESVLYSTVLIERNSEGFGTGFYLADSNKIYLVTARHVLFDPYSPNAKADTDSVTLSSIYNENENTRKVTITINLQDSYKNQNSKVAENNVDVAITLIGTKSNKDSILITNKFITEKYATVHYLDTEHINLFDEVDIGIETVFGGYPNTISDPDNPQIDYSQPLFRSGIVGGKNSIKKYLIIDSPSFNGNSGGPVIAIDRRYWVTKYQLIGVISQDVPYLEHMEQTDNDSMIVQKALEDSSCTATIIKKYRWYNSGYSVAIPIDVVLDLIDSF